jgi:acetyl-CoA C-acetyltransferase
MARPVPPGPASPGPALGRLTEVSVVAARRTPIGTAGHALARLTAADLGAAAITGVLADLYPYDLPEPMDVVLGNCLGPGGDVARVAALQAGLPVSVPGLTVDRQCGSGLAAIEVGAALVAARSGPVLAGGVESASTAPWRFWPPQGDRPPQRYERAPFAPAHLGDPEMGEAADLLADEAGVSRARQDAYAARSHALASATDFSAELVEVAGLTRDERPRTGLSLERLARMRPIFRTGGTVTAGNACGISDGAAVVALLPEAYRKRHRLPGLRLLATASAGVDPRRPGLGPVPAVRAALSAAGLTLGQMDVIEINEAFAAQLLACTDALGLDPDRVCRQGGALALGHPWGASGAVLMVRLFSQLVRAAPETGNGSDSGARTSSRPRYGLAAIAVGGGQGVAAVVEAVGVP